MTTIPIGPRLEKWPSLGPLLLWPVVLQQWHNFCVRIGG
jgi:hypothetical protein